MELDSRHFSSESPGPHLLVTGGVHGDEFEPILAIQRLIAHFQSRESLVRGSLTLIPVVNEAAYREGRRCTTDDGLDLARTCPGNPDGTITERVAHALSTLIRTADLYIDLHTGGTVLTLSPLVGYGLVEDPAILDQQRRLARAFNLPLTWGTSARHDGRSLSVARDARVPAIYAEYLGGGSCSENGIAAYVEGCLNVMAEWQMIDRILAPSELKHQVEDDRPGSGHLQDCHPSPIRGLFLPAVSLDDWIEPGQPLGQVIDPLGSETHSVPADHSGILIGLRTFPRVEPGDALGVIVSP